MGRIKDLIRILVSVITLDPIFEYESEASEKVIVRYRCSCCGHQNEAKARIRQKQTFSLSGFPSINYPQEKDIMEMHAHVSAVKKLQKKKEAVRRGSTAKAARAAGITCKCERCGRKEPWAKMDFSFFPATVAVGFLITVITLILGAVFKRLEMKTILFLCLLYAACVLLSLAAEGVVYLIRKIQIHRLPESSLPQFVFPDCPDKS